MDIKNDIKNNHTSDIRIEYIDQQRSETKNSKIKQDKPVNNNRYHISSCSTNISIDDRS